MYTHPYAHAYTRTHRSLASCIHRLLPRQRSGARASHRILTLSLIRVDKGSNHSDHSNHSNHSNHSDRSDHSNDRSRTSEGVYTGIGMTSTSAIAGARTAPPTSDAGGVRGAKEGREGKGAVFNTFTMVDLADSERGNTSKDDLYIRTSLSGVDQPVCVHVWLSLVWLSMCKTIHFCMRLCILIYLCVSMYIYIYRHVYVDIHAGGNM